MYDMYIFGTLILRNFHFNFKILFFFESPGYSKQISKTAREGWILPVQTFYRTSPAATAHSVVGSFFFESLMKSLFQSSKKPVRTFCQMEQCNFSTSKIERGERFPFRCRENRWKFSSNMEQYFTTYRSRNHPFTVVVDWSRSMAQVWPRKWYSDIPLKVFLFPKKISSEKDCSIWFSTGAAGFFTQKESAHWEVYESFHWDIPHWR